MGGDDWTRGSRSTKSRFLAAPSFTSVAPCGHPGKGRFLEQIEPETKKNEEGIKQRAQARVGEIGCSETQGSGCLK